MAQHALLAPSSAHRWLTCTPSAQLEAKFPDSESEYAAEGTFAHKWAELILRNSIEPSRHFKKKMEALKQSDDGKRYWSHGLEEFVDEYINVVDNKFFEAQKRDCSAELLLEQQLDMSKWIPGGFGHGDAVIVADGLMEIIDLKYGQNVRVTAENNPQLRLYALGAYQELSLIYDIERVAMSIVQPRNGGYSTEEMPIAELLAWGETIKPIAAQAIKGDGAFVPGKHCTFCKAKERCKALADYELEITKKEFQDVTLLSDEDIAVLLGRIDEFISWANGLKKYAAKEAIDNGKRWPGWKLVAGKSNRKLTDPAKAAEILLKAGFSETDIYKPREVLGFTDMEKLVGKKKLATLWESVITKPPGNPTLAPESDQRPEWSNPKEDFDKIPDEEAIPF